MIQLFILFCYLISKTYSEEKYVRKIKLLFYLGYNLSKLLTTIFNRFINK